MSGSKNPLKINDRVTLLRRLNTLLHKRGSTTETDIFDGRNWDIVLNFLVEREPERSEATSAIVQQYRQRWEELGERRVK